MGQVKKIILPLLMLFFLVLANVIKNQINLPVINVSLQERAININTPFIKVISLGNPRLISSAMWIKTLIDSDLEHYKAQDLNSWMFLRFKSITELDPRFYEAYLYGGLYLSIIKADGLGAKFLFDKGLEKYPNDYELLKQTAFHYHHELHDLDTASIYYKKLIQHQSTPLMYKSIYAKYLSGQGELREAFVIMHDTYTKLPKDSRLKNRLQNYLYAIKAEIDLDCLNTNKNNCSTVDFNNKAYIRNSQGEYEAITPWEFFRLKK